MGGVPGRRHLLPLLCALALLPGGASQAQDPAPATRARPRLVAQLGHAGEVSAVAPSPDGRWLLTGSADGTARLWESEGGREVRTLDGHRVKPVRGVAFAPDGAWCVTAGEDGTACLWEPGSGRLLGTLAAHQGGLTSVAVSADGQQILTGSLDKTARLWKRAPSGQFASVEPALAHTDAVRAVAFAPDGRRAVTGSQDGKLWIWEVGTGRPAGSFATHAHGPVRSVAVSPDGRQILSGGKSPPACLWDLESQRRLATFPPDTFGREVTGVAFTSDGAQVLTGDVDGLANLWERATGALVQKFEGHSDGLQAVALSGDGRYVFTASKDRTARRWDRASGQEAAVYRGRAARILATAFSADGRWLLAAGSDKAAHLWDLEAGREVRTFAGHTDDVTAVALSEDGSRVLTGSLDRSARLWDGRTGLLLHDLRPHGMGVTSVALSADGRWALTGSRDKQARSWDGATGSLLATYAGHGASVTGVALSPDGGWAATSSRDGTVLLWDRATGKAQPPIQAHSDGALCVAFSPDGLHVATGGRDRCARVWSRASRKIEANLEGQDGNVACVAFSPDGQRLLTGSEGLRARLWRWSDAQVLQTLEGHAQAVLSAAFAPDGRWLLTGSLDSTARLWEAETGRERCALISFSDGGWAVADAAGRYDGSRDGRVLGLHWVLGEEVVALEQLQSAYYEPGLLTTVLAARPLRAVPDFDRVGLPPTARVEAPTAQDPRLRIDIEGRDGGIGRVVVKINGTSLGYDARPAGAASTGPGTQVVVDLASHPLLEPGVENTIEVEVYNADNSLRSRGREKGYKAPGTVDATDPELWAVVCGVSDYAGQRIDLAYAAKDALAVASALRAAAEGLFQKKHVHLTLLATQQEGALAPTRANVQAAIEALQKAKPHDVVLLFLAGHGEMGGTPPDYHYLTMEAPTTDLAAWEAAALTTQAVSAAALEEWVRRIPARKKVLVFDTCHAGEAALRLGSRGGVSSDQVRVLARVRQAVGTLTLAGCAPDRNSYEDPRYKQGLLTYALLEGMKLGAASREGDLLEVQRLFDYARERVQALASAIGRRQEPLLSVPDLATTIVVGRLSPEARQGIVLAGTLPLFVRPDAQLTEEPSDPLGLRGALEGALREAADAQGRAVLAYVDVAQGEGAYRLACRYSVEGDAVRVRAYLRRHAAEGEQKSGEFELAGTKAALPALAADLVARALALVPREKP